MVTPTAARRVKVSATVDPVLLGAVDRYVAEHPGLDRSRVIDEALALWWTREQDRAMEAQFAEPADVDPAEWQSWQAVRDAATEQLFQRDRP